VAASLPSLARSRCTQYELDSEESCLSRNSSSGEPCEWCKGCWDCETNPVTGQWGCSNFCHTCKVKGECPGVLGKSCSDPGSWPECCKVPTKSPTKSPTTASPSISAKKDVSESSCMHREDIIARAWNWTKSNVTTNHCGQHLGYRTDCSGFVDFTLQLPFRAKSSNYGDFTYKIKKEMLLPGDVLVCPHQAAKNATDGGHVVLFHEWADENMTHYWLFELCNHPKCRGTFHRMVPYPYEIKEDNRTACFAGLVGRGGGPRRRPNLCKYSPPTASPTASPSPHE